ncbi:hypothetical protein O9992_16070 [Vibrio lentus]|nr:hypothetical protein [Vibrio lentus]
MLSEAVAQKTLGLKETPATFYYYLMDKMGDQHLHSNVGDFRLMSQRVVAAINTLEERLRYMQGYYHAVGYDVAIIEFDRVELFWKYKIQLYKTICHASL